MSVWKKSFTCLNYLASPHFLGLSEFVSWANDNELYWKRRQKLGGWTLIDEWVYEEIKIFKELRNQIDSKFSKCSTQESRKIVENYAESKMAKLFGLSNDINIWADLWKMVALSSQ